MRTIFFGTPEIAVPALEALTKTTEVVGVVSQPDRPSGRGLELSEPAVKRAAVALGLPLYQPVKVRTGELEAWVRERSPDVAVVLAYGRILPDAVLGAPRLGCMNLHASLLPRYRGAAPIQWAIIRGETETGVSLMQMDAGLDSGPVYARRALPILPDDDAATLSGRMAELCADVIRNELGRALSSELQATPQDPAGVTLAPPLTREHGLIDWTLAPEGVANLVRGLSPRPGAYTTLGGKTLKVLSSRPIRSADSQGTPGVVVRADKGGLFVACTRGVVEIVRGQLEGRRAMGAPDLVNGRSVRLGDILGT